MKVLRPLLAFGMLIAALLAFSAQQQGSGALVAQGAYLGALLILIIDRLAMMKKDPSRRGQAVGEVALGLLVASLLFSPDFANAVQRKRPGLPVAELIQATESEDTNVRAMALEICLQRRLFKACKASFEKASQSSEELIKALGASGLRGRSGLKR